MAERIQSTPAAARSGRRAGEEQQHRPHIRPVDVLLQRVVVVANGRADELVAGLSADGMTVRAVSPEAVATMVAGLVVVEEGEEAQSALEALATLQRRGSSVASVLLARDVGHGPSINLINKGADVVLPALAPVALVAAQLRALARLIGLEPPGAEPEIITIRGISVDLDRREVRAGGRPLNLTPTEFRILSLLARKRGVVSHGELFREIHGYDVSDQEAKDILKVHIWRLRAKLAEAVPDSNAIVNVRGFGYLLERRSGRERRNRGEADRMA